MENNKNINSGFTVLQASQMLDMTTKTVYNYIKKSILVASKWNGIWIIEKGHLLELKNKLISTETISQGPSKRGPKPRKTNILVERQTYENLLRQAGQVTAMENLFAECLSRNHHLEQRITELERELSQVREEAVGRGFWKRLRPKRKKSIEGRHQEQ